MKYIRYIIYFAFYSALVVGGMWLYGLFRGTGFPRLSALSRPVVTIAVLALLPIFKALNKKKTIELPKIQGIESNALVLECRYRARLPLAPSELRSAMREICESLLFPDRYLALSYEDDAAIEYRTMALDVDVGAKRPRKSRIPLSTVSIEIEAEGELSRLLVASKSENLFSTLDNDANEEHISAIVGALFDRGLLGDPRLD